MRRAVLFLFGLVLLVDPLAAALLAIHGRLTLALLLTGSYVPALVATAMYARAAGGDTRRPT